MLVKLLLKHGAFFAVNLINTLFDAANWVRQQREKYRINKVPADRLRKLRIIGFDIVGAGFFGAWEKRFKELEGYKKRHGECSLPLRFEHEKALKDWAHKQKHKYMENKLPKEHLSRLKKLGFDFLPFKEHGFGDKYELLLKFKAEHNHCDVPRDYKEDSLLARWVEVQVNVVFCMSYSNCSGMSIQLTFGSMLFLLCTFLLSEKNMHGIKYQSNITLASIELDLPGKLVNPRKRVNQRKRTKRRKKRFRRCERVYLILKF